MSKSKRAKARRDLRQLEKKEENLIEALAVSIANRDHLDDDVQSDKKHRDRLKSRKAAGKSYDEDLLDELNREIREGNERLAEVRKNIRDRRGWLKSTRIKIKRGRRRLRNMVRPKIIDLNLEFRDMAIQGAVDKVIGHYTAGPVDEGTGDAIRLNRSYHQAHLNKGWSGEAYMVNFTTDGDILILRPARFVGAHTLGENTGSYGVVCHGTTGDKPTKAQKRAMRWWAKNGHKRLMGDARTSVQPKRLRWYGHNDFNATSCPGSFKSTYRRKGAP